MAYQIMSIQHLTKRYGSKTAVNDLSLTVEAGDIYGFIGHNGAGKTTTIRAAVGVMDFDQGEIFITGHSVRKEPMACKAVTAYIPDNPDIYEHLTGIQYLNFIADMFGVDATARTQRIGELAERLTISGDLGSLIGSYSHGMKQKLALISAFVHDPRLLVLDEPFVGLDPKASFDLKEMMREMCQRGGAIFFSTHVLDVAEKLCNKIAIIKDGRLVASGDTATIRGDASLEQVFLEVVDHA